MLTQIELNNWKSFKNASLFFDKLTILIGTNSSGKSNLLDALLLLKRFASGQQIRTALAGDQNIEGIRGGLDWACLKPNESFCIQVVCSEDEDYSTEYHYMIEIVIRDSQAYVKSEHLKRLKYRKNSRKKPYVINLFKTEDTNITEPSIVARLYNERKGSPYHALKSVSVLSQLYNHKTRKEIKEGIDIVRNDLANIFILDPIPSHMRNYCSLSDDLKSDASNVAGVLAALTSENKINIENAITSYVKEIPEKDITRIYTETVGKFGLDAMLYCDERWTDSGPSHTVDARGMSDGTLRFIAIVTALLTLPEGSTLIIEEVDNGLHPSRAYVLVKILKNISYDRNIDVLITTHNPTLLNEFGTEFVPFITVAHRDSTYGDSRLTLLENINMLPKMLASGPVGMLSSTGEIEKALEAK